MCERGVFVRGVLLERGGEKPLGVKKTVRCKKTPVSTIRLKCLFRGRFITSGVNVLFSHFSLDVKFINL